MSHHIKGQSRPQTTLFPEAIDDFVTQDNPIRVIDVFVGQLDLLALGFEAVNAKLTEKEVNEHPDKQVSQTDPDACLMHTHHMERRVCYNVQSAVDAKHHLIVEHDVTMTVDRGQLTLVAAQVQKTVGKKNITIIADKGYFSRNDIKATQDLGMTEKVPQTDTSGAAKKGVFNKSLFKYDAHQDIYICPAGEELPHRRSGLTIIQRYPF
jgi:hypothetical protein